MKINNHGLKYEDLVIKDAETKNYFLKFKGLDQFKDELNKIYGDIVIEIGSNP